ncbi:endonuclease/exonuclease/phosphatase family protein [Maribellus sp. CM-23]|uniref:endonuclease/exonuclease/phosphatase family protein n=1 Tax=Maribellus sp. CM-23 TaxID=2781026 RepID=UPI001F300396|nr:endonuclease/exonuclease/phosphatase family protein [Maribellus sp. CM-23]MCE4562809.1 endonuclease/exonuclease/phosphatase family protein [Maribellus sp. CM-23]
MGFRKEVSWGRMRCLLLALALCAGLFAKATEPLCPQNTKQDAIRVLSYNIRIAHPPSGGWDLIDLPAIGEAINRIKPDLVALQEVDVFTERSGKTVHQAKELAKMTGMNYFFAKAVDRSGGDYGVAVLSRFPIVEAQGYRLPVRDSIKSEIRALALVKVQLPDGSLMAFGSAHLDHLSDDDRLLQVKTMIDVIEAYQQYPLVIGADLNMKPDNPVMSKLKESLIFGCENCPLTFPADNPDRTLDYILLNEQASGQFKMLDYQTVNETYASDHLPLEAILKKN